MNGFPSESTLDLLRNKLWCLEKRQKFQGFQRVYFEFRKRSIKI